MTPAEVLSLATSILQRDDFGMHGVWPRAVALLGRQSLEGGLDSLWDRSIPVMKQATRRTQCLCLDQFVRDRDLAEGVRTAWASLSAACHHHPYELSPSAAELRSWLDKVERLITRLDAEAREGMTLGGRQGGSS
jgi:hypothetical protein